MQIGKQEALAKQALTMKKAHLLTLLWGAPGHLDATDTTIPNYPAWSRTDLETMLDDLRAAFAHNLKHIIVRPNRTQTAKAAPWFAAQYDRFIQSGQPTLTLCTVQKFEQTLGPLRFREIIETPPYGELFLQAGTGRGLTIRHPEYMLTRDLGLHYDLYRDALDLLADVDSRNLPAWAVAANMNQQTLARTVIITCFNLLEAFTSGLARAHLMTHPDLPQDHRAQLTDQRSPLQRRILRVPNTIRPGLHLDPHQHPMHPLFDSIKKRRDAFVHCEPGPHVSSHGYIKQEAFYDTPPALVDETLDCTITLIRRIWRHVHQTDGPRWLHPRHENGRFDQHNLNLTPQQHTQET